MEFTDADIQLIEDAIMDRLSDENRLLLDERLKDDQFVAEYESYRLMIGVVESEGKSQLKNSLQKLDKTLAPPQDIRKRTIPMYVRWLVAASLIGIFGYLGIYKSDSGATHHVYIKYYESYPNIIDPITKGSESGEMSPFQLYESGKYQAAQLAFSDLEESEDRDFYEALIYMEMDDFGSAITRLSQIGNEDTHRFYPDARWYLALAHLGAGNAEEAHSILLDITKTENDSFSDRARQLLKDLE